MSYISHEDYKNLMSKFQGETSKGILKEAEEMTPKQKKFAALAPPTDKITYADKIVGAKKDVKNEYSYTDNYPGSWGYNEGQEDSNDPMHSRAYDMAAKLMGMGQGKDEVYQFLVNKQNVDGAVAQSMVDDLFGSDDIEGYGDEIPRDYDSFSDYNDGEFWEGVDESGHGDAPISKMSRKDMIEFLGTTEEEAKGMSDQELRDAVEEKNEDMKEGLNPAPMQATGPTVDVKEVRLNVQSPEEVAKFVAAKHPELGLKMGIDREKTALKHAYDVIVNASGEVVARNLVNSLSNPDWPSDYLQALKGMLANKEGLKPAPMQATGQSLKENTVANPPYGFDVLPPGTKQQLQTSGLKELSPDDRKRLKEYIESVKEIQKEIVKLAAKAGKKIKMEGGNMTGLTLGPSVTSEDEGAIKVGDIVIPNLGPHKGQKHVVIAVLPDGTFNIKPQWPGLSASQIKYRQGAAKAKADQIQKVNEDDDAETQHMISKMEKEKEGEEAVKGQYDPH